MENKISYFGYGANRDPRMFERIAEKSRREFFEKQRLLEKAAVVSSRDKELS